MHGNANLTEGNGTEQNPYLLQNEWDIFAIVSGKIQDNKETYYKLANDIVLTAKEWTPIHEFNGMLDGCGHTISGLKINETDDKYTGFIATNNGTIKNLTVSGKVYDGKEFTGILVGNNNGTIDNCKTTGENRNNSRIAGGLVGYNCGSVLKSSSSVNVTGMDGEKGGLVGENGYLIECCYATGEVEKELNGNNLPIGGLASNNFNSINNCYARGKVTMRSTGNAGGLVGCNSQGKIDCCYATGSVTGDQDKIGGLVGYNGGLARYPFFQKDKDILPHTYIKVEEVKLDVYSSSMTVGDILKINADILPFEATELQVIWSSGNEAVASVEDGLITAKGVGTVQIKAMSKESPEIFAICVITVKEKQNIQPVYVSSINIKGISKKIACGTKVKLIASVLPDNASNHGIKWSTSNKKYATVTQNGVVSVKKAGAGKRVTITATSLDGSVVRAVYKIQIMKHAVKSIKIKKPDTGLKAGSTIKLITTVKTTGANANKTLKWSSTNPRYATVDRNGKVKTFKKGKGKNVTITAMATDGTNKKSTIKLKIK